ncbi:MAG: metal-dependent hydrolase [Pirellulales bacterium]
MIQIQWLGHSSWLISTEEVRIAIDPFLTDNPKASCKPDQIEADVILVSHGHFDHVQDVAAIANRCNSLVVANYEIATWFSSKHHVANTLGMNLGGWASIPHGRVKSTIAHHSSQLPDGSYGGNPGGYVIELEGKRIYYAGDTALFSDMGLIGRMNIDVAIVPVGDLFTMGLEDSIQATEWIHPKVVLPTHYDTWPPIACDTQEWAQQIRSRTQATPVVLQPGQSYSC